MVDRVVPYDSPGVDEIGLKFPYPFSIAKCSAGVRWRHVSIQ